jgi:hypothetical protein
MSPMKLLVSSTLALIVWAAMTIALCFGIVTGLTEIGMNKRDVNGVCVVLAFFIGGWWLVLLGMWCARISKDKE